LVTPTALGERDIEEQWIHLCCDIKNSNSSSSRRRRRRRKW